MFEAIVASFLSSYLGKYIQGLEKQNLNVALGSGSVTLKKLRIRVDALDNLNFPVVVRAGEISQLDMTIPWTALGSSPSIIQIEGLYLRLRPAEIKKGDTEEHKKRQQATKMSRLKIAEMLAKSEFEGGKVTQNEQDTWTQQMINSILANLQIHIKSVHIRMEDSSSNPSHPFAFGVTMESLHLQSANSNYEEAHIEGKDYRSTKYIYKLVKVSNLAFYWNSDVEPMPKGRNTRNQIMDKLIYREGDFSLPPLHYIIRPFSLQFRMRINRVVAAEEVPKYTIHLMLENIGLFLMQNQIQNMIQLGNRLAHYTQAIVYAQFKPKILLEQQEKELKMEEKEEEEGEGGDEEGKIDKERGKRRERAQGRWKFCLLAVLHDVRKKREMWLWENMMECRRNRKKYVDFYVKRNQGAVLEKEEEEEWERLIHLLDFDSQLLCRKMGLKFLQKDRLYREQMAKQKPKEDNQPAQQGWGSWTSSWFVSPTEEGEEAPLEMTPELWKELQTVIGLDLPPPSSSSSSPFPPSPSSSSSSSSIEEYIKTEASFSVKSFQIFLLDGNVPFSSQVNEIHNSFTSMKFTNLFASVKSSAFSDVMKIDSGELKFCDNFTKNAVFPVILKTDELTEGKGGGGTGSKIERKSLSFVFERRVGEENKHEHEYFTVNGTLYPSTVVVSSPLMKKIVSFVRPKSQQNFFSDFEKEAVAKIQSLTEQTQSSLAHALHNSRRHLSVEQQMEQEYRNTNECSSESHNNKKDENKD